MLKGTATTKVIDRGMKDLNRRLRDESATHVDVGIHSDEDQKLIVIAAANEFGATINHPGGTAYGYATADDARAHRVRFLKGGSGFKVLGVTKPHTIVIPARPYIRSAVDENEGKYFNVSKKIMGKMIDGKMTKAQGLEIMGQMIEGDIKKQIIRVRTPPNKPGTIRAKGSDNPLVNTGMLSGSIRFVVKGES